MMKRINQRIDSILSTRKGILASLLIVYLLCVLFLYFTFGINTFGPVHFNDEIIYFRTALSIFKGVFGVKEFHHFPPVYPLSLLPAFLFFYPNKIYPAIKLLNVLYISSAIFPIYLILRNFLNKKESLIALIVLILGPINVVIPRSVLSENIFYPLLFWSIYFTFIRTSNKNKLINVLEDLLLGVLYTALIFTRYIAIAVVPGLFLIWLIKLFFCPKFSKKQVFHYLSRILLVALPILLVTGLWLYSGLLNGLPAKEMLGFSITGNPNPLQTTPYLLFMWIVFYLAYFCLMLGPSLLFFLLSLINIKNFKVDQKYYQWFFACLIISGTFLIASIEHSWSAGYNFPVPIKIQGRYILYLGPLFYISALVFIKQFTDSHISSFKKIAASGISLILLIFSYLILFKGIIFIDKPLSIAKSSPDGYLFGSLGYWYLFIIMLLFLLFSIIQINSKILI